MPQLLLIAAAGVAVWYGYKAVKREMDRVGKAVRDVGNDKTEQVVAELEQDPKTGVYKPKE